MKKSVQLGVALLLLLGYAGTVLAVPAIVSPATDQELPGKFVWFELVTDDLDKTLDFYGQLLGWEFSTEQDYTLISYRGERLGGVVESNATQEGANLWIPSLSVTGVGVGGMYGNPYGYHRRGYYGGGGPNIVAPPNYGPPDFGGPDFGGPPVAMPMFDPF